MTDAKDQAQQLAAEAAGRAQAKKPNEFWNGVGDVVGGIGDAVGDVLGGAGDVAGNVFEFIGDVVSNFDIG